VREKEIGTVCPLEKKNLGFGTHNSEHKFIKEFLSSMCWEARYYWKDETQ
jgi:hypothetical protein